VSGGVRIRYWAAARDAAGTAEEDGPAGPLAALLAAAVARHGPALSALLGCCSFLVDGERRGRADGREIPAGAVVEVLPPFAGG
jgi:sulfur-carrier protein